MAGCFSHPSKLASLRNGTIVLLLLVSSYSHLEAGLSVGPTSPFYIASCLPLIPVHPHTASSQYHSCSLLFISSCLFHPFFHILLLCDLQLFLLWSVKYMEEAVPNLKVLPQHWLGCKSTLNAPTWKIWWANNVSRWQVGFNSAFKGLKIFLLRNAIDAHAQFIVENDEMLLTVLKTLTHFTLTQQATINSWRFQSVF